MEVELTRGFEDDNGTGPALLANIPIKNIKPVAHKVKETEENVTAEKIVEEVKEHVEELKEKIEKLRIWMRMNLP